MMTGYIKKGESTMKIESLENDRVRVTITRSNMRVPLIFVGSKDVLKKLDKIN